MAITHMMQVLYRIVIRFIRDFQVILFHDAQYLQRDYFVRPWRGDIKAACQNGLPKKNKGTRRRAISKRLVQNIQEEDFARKRSGSPKSEAEILKKSRQAERACRKSESGYISTAGEDGRQVLVIKTLH